MTAATITREGNSLVVSGDLVFQTILQVLHDSKPLLATLPEWTIRLSAVRHADSAGLALLITWFRASKIQSKNLVFCDIPVQMQKIINVSGLTKILPIR